MLGKNIDEKVVEAFGDEWVRFDQAALSLADLQKMFDGYFRIFPWERISPNSIGFDLGCGSGRWARLVAPRVGQLHCIDPSEDALKVARRNLAGQGNCTFHHASVDTMPLPDSSCDFGYSLGVLHHVPDPAAGIRSCVLKLKPGAPFLLYMYYALDNRPAWYRGLWKLSELIRGGLSRAPRWMCRTATDLIAAGVYWPLARLAGLAERMGRPVSNFPLAGYRDKSFYVMRNDCLDRFGTSLERRFTRGEMRALMEASGLRDVVFSDQAPFWCALGFASSGTSEKNS